MDEEFNPDDLRPIPYRPDTEVLLGPWMMGSLLFGLILLCVIFFSLGYTMGKHGAHSPLSTVQQKSAQASPLTAGSGAKPSAIPQASNRARPAANNSPATNGVNAATSPDSQVSVSPAPAITAPALALMVQIAAVSHKEDADVLAGALRKHGYAVTTRHDPADNLIHVQVGPFSSRNDANAMRQKLLNDGYNAVVQP